MLTLIVIFLNVKILLEGIMTPLLHPKIRMSFAFFYEEIIVIV